MVKTVKVVCSECGNEYRIVPGSPYDDRSVCKRCKMRKALEEMYKKNNISVHEYIHVHK